MKQLLKGVVDRRKVRNSISPYIKQDDLYIFEELCKFSDLEKCEFFVKEEDKDIFLRDLFMKVSSHSYIHIKSEKIGFIEIVDFYFLNAPIVRVDDVSYFVQAAKGIKGE